MSGNAYTDDHLTNIADDLIRKYKNAYECSVSIQIILLINLEHVN